MVFCQQSIMPTLDGGGVLLYFLPTSCSLLASSFIHKSQPTMFVIRHALLLFSVASVAAAATATATATATASATLEEAEFAFFNGGFVDYRLGPVPVAVAVSTGGAEESSVGGNDRSKGTHYGDPADGCMKDEVR